MSFVRSARPRSRCGRLGTRAVPSAILAVLLVGILSGCNGAGSGKSTSAHLDSSPSASSSSSLTTTTEHQTPVPAGGQPDVHHPSATLTPGATFPGVTAAQICVAGYSASVRNVSDATRSRVFAEYGLSGVDRSQYEVDHLIALELGGSNDLTNLWPEPLEGGDGAKDKDTVENRLHDLVCSGQVTLSDAQVAIVHWDTIDLAALVTATTSTTAPPVAVPPSTTAPVAAPPVTPPPVTAPPATEAPVTPGDGATALCNDGTYSYAAHHQGACSHHGGVAVFYK